MQATVYAEVPTKAVESDRGTSTAIPEPLSVPDILPITKEATQNDMPVSSIALVPSTHANNTERALSSPTVGDAGSDEDEGNRMNIYNLNTGKCVQAEIVSSNNNSTSISSEDQDINLDAIQGILLLDQINEDASKRAPVTEDLYAEIRKPPKKSPEAVVVANATVSEEKVPRSVSPEWTYTLPAPTHFADGNGQNNLLMVANGQATGPTNNRQQPDLVPTETFNGNNVYYSYSENDDGESIAARSMTTTVVSDVLIKPVIKERIPMLEQPLMLPLDDDHFNANHSESSDFNSSSTLTSASPNGLHGEEEAAAAKRKKLIINSDIEDGYHGPQEPIERMLVNQGLIATLEKRREKFIENELEQLVSAESLHGDMELVLDSGDMEESINRDTIILFEEQAKSKSTAIAAENQEPTISRSPIEDGLPSDRGFLHRSVIESDSGKESSDLFNSTATGDERSGFTSSSEESKNESLETSTLDHHHSGSHAHMSSNQSFEQRRSSFLADMESSKNAFNRRPMTNELSISDSPSSLQSLQVMRDIMMTTGSRGKEGEIVAKEEVPEKMVKEVRAEEIAPVIVPVAVAQPVTVETKPWKYTGPPKINLGSWSERPKVQVCLKTDSDYHHSLQKAAAAAAAAAEQSKHPLSPVSVDKKTETAFESPEKLPVVRSMELKRVVSVPEDMSVVEPVVARTVEASEPVAVKAKIQRPVSMHSTRFTPTVRGFLASNKERQDSAEIRSTKINPVLMRSDSNVVAKANGGIALKSEVTVVEKEVVKSPPATLEKPIMFSQSTLRRTGLKDRILASQPDPATITKDKEATVLETVPQIKLPSKSVLVQEVISSPVSPPPPPPPPMAMPVKASGGPLLNPLARLSSPADDQKAPQKPIVRGMVAKKPFTPEVDPREQLLDSIRNFSFKKM